MITRSFWVTILTLATLSSVIPRALAGPGEARAMLQMADNSRRTGYIQNSNEQAILFSTDEGVPGQTIALNQVKIAFLEANETMAPARQLYNRADFKGAAAEFGRVAEEFKTIAFIPDNFACEARYYQLDCLRKVGDFKAMAALMASQVTKNIATKLNANYQRPFQFLTIWATFGSGNLDSLKTVVDNAQAPVIGDMKLLGAPVWQKMSLSELSQIAYLRGRFFEKEGKTREALEDYWRTATLTQGNDPAIRNLAIEAAMVLLKANPKIADGPENNPALWELQSTAWVYKKVFNKGEVPLGFGEYAIKPQMPEVPTLKPKNTEQAPADAKPADAGSKPGDAKPAAAPPGEAKPAAAPPANGKPAPTKASPPEKPAAK